MISGLLKDIRQSYMAGHRIPIWPDTYPKCFYSISAWNNSTIRIYNVALQCIMYLLDCAIYGTGTAVPLFVRSDPDPQFCFFATADPHHGGFCNRNIIRSTRNILNQLYKSNKKTRNIFNTCTMLAEESWQHIILVYFFSLDKTGARVAEPNRFASF